jgi:hypothetical protein
VRRKGPANADMMFVCTLMTVLYVGSRRNNRKGCWFAGSGVERVIVVVVITVLSSY